MCRLLGILSTKPTNGRKYLFDDQCSLYAQSYVNPKKLQRDGWGLGYYVNGSPKMIKSEKPIYMERRRFISAINSISSKIIIAHIRRASNPRGLPRERLISIENSQPFTYDRYLFAHNGVIRIPDEVLSRLGRWRSMVEGLNDSEVYFWYIIKRMIDYGDSFKEALIDFQRTLWDLWSSCRENYPSIDRPYQGLNAIFSDGKHLYAYAKYDEKRITSTSICFKDQPSLQMSYILKSNSLVVASEKTNREEEWKPLKSGQLLVAWFSDETINLEIERI